MEQEARDPSRKPNQRVSVDNIDVFGSFVEAMKGKLEETQASDGDSDTASKKTPYVEEKSFENKDFSEEDRKEKMFLVQLAMKQQELRNQNLKNKQLSDDIDLRKNFAERIFWFVVMTTFVAGLVIFHSGAKVYTETPDGKFVEAFFLSDQVLIALITAVTVNIMAALLIIMRNLFPTHQTEQASSKN